MKNVAIAVLAFFLILSPLSAAQKAISKTSLDSSYKAQIAEIDNQILILTEEKKSAFSIKVKSGGINIRPTQIQAEIQKLEQDKHTLELTYNLLVGALK